MDLRNALRRRRADGQPDQATGPPDDSAAPRAEGQPFDGYDRLSDKQVMASLSKHSQVELVAIEGYERAHKARPSVIDKLRYMRGREPVPGYDAMSSAEIVTMLDESDLTTINRIRAYERKFGGRALVLEKVLEVHGTALAAQPREKAPPYQSGAARAEAAALKASSAELG